MPTSPTASAASSHSATAAATCASTSCGASLRTGSRRTGFTPEDCEGIRAHLLSEYAAWSPQTLRMITDNDGPCVDRPLFALPVPHTWEHSPSVTLLGDAAHLMPPLGVGVNLAMLDASELALALVHSATIDDAVHSYEKSMLRARPT